MHVSVLSGTTRHLLEENNQAFGQISANLSTLKVMLELTVSSQGTKHFPCAFGLGDLEIAS